MSVKAMSYVWDTPYKGAKKLMLLAIADRCDDEGTCYPGVTKLSEKCSVKTRAAQALITELETSGEIVVQIGTGIETGHGKTNRYYMKNYRTSIGLKTPVHGTRIQQITPRENGMQNSASLDYGVQNSASQAMQDPASQGMQNSAYNTSGYPSVDTSVKETTTTPAATRQTHVFPINDSDLSFEADDPAMFVPKGKKEMSARAENGANRLSKDTATTSPSPSPLPAADVKSAQAFSAGMKDDVPADKGTKKRKPNRTAQIIDSVWGKGVSGGLLPMLMGRAKRKPHADYNIEDGMTEIEIFAFSRWYRKQNPGLNMPEIPYKVHDSIESFRNAMDYDGWMDEGERYILGYFPKEETATAVLGEERATPEEIITFKQQIAEQLVASGLDGMFGDLFDDYKQENIS